MVRSLYFTNRKEYYQRKKISLALKNYWKKKKGVKKKVYFVNFSIKQNEQYLNGSLITGKRIPLTDSTNIIKSNIPDGYTPVKFYEAEEEGEQTKTELILMREDQEFFRVVINV